MFKATATRFVSAGLLGLALLLPRPAAAAGPTDSLLSVPHSSVSGERIPWSRGWSVSVCGSGVLKSGFADELGRQMSDRGWGVYVPPSTTQPFWGVYERGHQYPYRIEPAATYRIRVAHAITPILELAGEFAAADLGGQRGYDGRGGVWITGSLRSISALLFVAGLLVPGDRLRIGAGPTLDLLTTGDKGSEESSVGIGIGLTLQASLRLIEKRAWFAGLALGQHFGASHAIGPYDVGGWSQFPAIKLSPSIMTFGLEFGLRQPIPARHGAP
jgi:hypothetical protein